jgi:hypothetical protein
MIAMDSNFDFGLCTLEADDIGGNIYYVQIARFLVPTTEEFDTLPRATFQPLE